MMYEYRAEVLKIVDGDTVRLRVVRLRVDLGLDVRIDVTCRLAGIDAPERSTAEGVNATHWLEEQLAGNVVIAQTVKGRREKYGRYLVWLYKSNLDAAGGIDASVNYAMVEAGHARRYDGGAR